MNVSRALPVFAVFLLLLATVSADWYNSNWSYRKAVTIDASKIPSTQTNFPVLVKLNSDSDLANDAQADGDDILFTSSDGSTKLSHEIEDFNSSTGELVAWVKVPSLSGSASTTLYMYYGNASASSQQDANNVWDVNYVMVQHLSETSGTHNDSTSNDNDGTPKSFGGTMTFTAGSEPVFFGGGVK